MTAPFAIRVLGPLALAATPLALQAAPGDQPLRVYSARMETLFIRLDVNRDGRLDASEVQGRRVLNRVLQRQNNRSYLLLEDLRLPDASPSGPRLKHHFSLADRNRNRRLDPQEAKRIPWISRNFTALDRDRDGTVTLQELWTHQRSLAPPQRRP